MLKIRTRLFVVLVVLLGLGLARLLNWMIDDFRPRYLATMEEAMVDMANVLAASISVDATTGTLDVDGIRAALAEAGARRFNARIYEATKRNTNVRVYVTDKMGKVLFDSDHGRDEGKDYSQWIDVARTLRGEYGARATRSEPNDPMTSDLCVAAPIKRNGEIVGVLSVSKPTTSVAHFLSTATRNVAVVGVLSMLLIIAVALFVSVWITRPIEQLIVYVQRVRDGLRATLPRFGRGEMRDLGVAFEEMRRALEGKQYIEDYVQTLTHEMKAPLTAIRGAAELLGEEMPADDRERFLGNIRTEAARIQDLVDRMLDLAALENRDALRDVEVFDLGVLAGEVVAELSGAAAARKITMVLDAAEPTSVAGERFPVREALSNLVHNALDFSSAGGTIRVTVRPQDTWCEVRVDDAGPGIPDYALGKVFDRFYSLARPGNGKKSSGLGLTIVRAVAELHGGTVTLENGPSGGARATLRLPITR